MANIEDLRTQLIELTSSLGKAQKQVARLMLENFEAVAYMTASELAERAGVHTATAIRLAQRLGYEGYPQLQRAIRSTLSNYPRFLQSLETDHRSDSGTAITETVFAHARRNLEQLSRSVSLEDLEKAADTLASAREVLVFGIGVVAPVVEYLGSSLRLLGIRTSTPRDFICAAQQLALLSRGDVLVVIDFHRYYRAIPEVASAAARKRVEVIALTDSEVSPLVSTSDLALFVPSDSPAPRTSLLPALAMVEALLSLAARVGQERARDSMRLIDDSYTDLHVFVDT
ncbi:MurR/RpiR family transcriptional regulator [Salinicola corii]|uniref:MurR/RpiR family transcriptional regulator n=1 Tax=Salinicola corii TaxID=2606937 RepID=A0A640W6X8_9GAMM|nr:MurR/RpiR family transcriptional regulator [Salinicola corii]KAA0015079.1 MurR/RpiR family transcriptional regulator [Salinicola corii]